MIYKERPDIAEFYIQRIRDMLTGTREIPAIRYEGRGQEIHLSDLQLCPLPAIYKRTLKNPPEMDKGSALRFLRGRAIEKFIATEIAAVEKDGILGTADDMMDGVGLTEIKSTAKGSEFFDPVKQNSEWTERMMGYCYILDQKDINLIVFFISGNMSDYSRWAIKENKKRPKKYCGVDLKAWRFEFTDKELYDNWEEMKRRRDVILGAIKNGNMPSEEYVKNKRPDWQCKACIYSIVCYIMKVKEVNDEKEK